MTLTAMMTEDTKGLILTEQLTDILVPDNSGYSSPHMLGAPAHLLMGTSTRVRCVLKHAYCGYPRTFLLSSSMEQRPS